MPFVRANTVAVRGPASMNDCSPTKAYGSIVATDRSLPSSSMSMLESEYSLAAEQLLMRKQTNLKTITIAPTDTAAEALHLIKEFDVSQLPVVEDGVPKGSVNENALVALFVKHTDPKSVKVSEIMTAPFPVVAADAPLEDVAKLLTRENPAVLVTCADGDLGIITKYDLISHIAR